MSSPLPGMDPYIEGSLWTTFHTQLCVEIAGQLAPRLRPRYLPMTEKRFIVAEPEDVEGLAIGTVDLYADAAKTEADAPAEMPISATVALASPPLRLATLMPEPVPHVTVEIRDVENRQLVTVIEVHSPTNKRGQRRLEYLPKRQRILLSTAHLIEIELLRSDQRVPMQKPLPSAPYFVFLSRAESRPVVDVWPISLGDSLPKIPVPLLPGDQDIELDLQLAFSEVYVQFSYDLAIRYDRPPAVPLEASAAILAAGFLERAKAQMNFEHRNILITGAGSGVGRGLAQALADEGHRLFLADLRLQTVEETVKLLAAESDQATAHAFNVASSDAIAGFLQSIGDQRIDVVINNAGVQHVQNVDEFLEEKWDLLIDVMLKGPFLLTKAILPRMRKNGFGRIVNIGSIHALVASPFKSAYVAAKHGLLGLSKVVALETAAMDITMNTICPAYVRTPLVEAQIEAQAANHGISKQEVIDKIMLEPMPKKAFVTIEEIAAAVNFFISPHARNITGQTLVIDGGWTAK